MMTAAKDFPNFDAQTYASQGNAVLGIRDSGKSYTAVLLAERLYDAKIPFVTFDPIGKWRFMRAPGKGKGYPVVVAGGSAGDLPLTVDSAPAIVRAAMEAGISIVIDLYDMEISKADWRRIVAECVRVLLYENTKFGLRHIFIEEAAEFCPQRVAPDQGRVYAEIEKLARMGGNARLGYTLINQRSEEVSKAVLELCDTLFLHRQKGKNSLNSLTKWLDVADVAQSREIIKTLSTLPQGQCWAWMTGDNKPTLVKVPQKNSFEPDRRAMGNQSGGTPPKPVSVSSFVEIMRSTLADDAAKAKTKDTAVIRNPPAIVSGNNIATLQFPDLDKARTLAFEEGRISGHTGCCNSIVGDLRRLQNKMEDAAKELDEFVARYSGATGVITIAPSKITPADFRAMHESTWPEQKTRVPKEPGEPRDAGTAYMKPLRVLAKHHPARFTYAQWATLSIMSKKSSTWRAHLAAMRRLNYLEEHDGVVGLSAAGREAAGVVPPAKQSPMEMWASVLPQGSAELFRILCQHPRGMERDALAKAANIIPTSSTYRAHLAKLRANGLVTKDGTRIGLDAILFEGR